MEEGYEYMEELASGETVQQENEEPEETGEGAPEGEETGGEAVEIFPEQETAVTEPDTELDTEPGRVTLVTYISEYFLPETGDFPENVSAQQVTVQDQTGETTGIMKLEYEIKESAMESGTVSFRIPVTLREKYRYPAKTVSYPMVQEEPLNKDCNGAGTFLAFEENGEKLVLAEGIAPVLEVEAAPADMSISLTAETKEPKTGMTIRYRLDLANTGKLDLTDIRLTSSFSCPKIAQQWEKAEGLVINGGEGELAELGAGETRSFYILAPLMNEQEKDLEHQVEAEALVKERPEEVLLRKAVTVDSLKALKADFSVKKTADRETASPGETVTYQICIVNTGEKTLHSVVGTEKFKAQGIKARFVEQEGVTLNSTGTKALIPEIRPGEAVSLQAVVTIPEKTADQKLFNQVTVVTRETGERTVEASAQIMVKGNTVNRQEEKTPEERILQETEAAGEGMARAASDHPKTGDDTEGELQTLLMLTAGMTCLGCFWLRRKYRDIHGKS